MFFLKTFQVFVFIFRNICKFAILIVELNSCQFSVAQLVNICLTGRQEP